MLIAVNPPITRQLRDAAADADQWAISGRLATEKGCFRIRGKHEAPQVTKKSELCI